MWCVNLQISLVQLTTYYYLIVLLILITFYDNSGALVPRSFEKKIIIFKTVSSTNPHGKKNKVSLLPYRCEGADVLSALIMIDGKEEKIDSYCGANLPRPLMSNGPRLVLEFKGIYSSRLSRGFQATYSFTEGKCTVLWNV